MEKNFDYNSIDEKITLCKDGKYRWRYDLSLFKNGRIFFLVWKILFFVFLVLFTIIIITDIINWGITPERLSYNLKFLAYFFIGMTAVSALGYLIYAAIMGGKYCVIFEMDEKGINHMQIPEQAKKAKKIADVTSLAGAATGSMSTVGVGMNAARTELYSDFSKVKKVKAYKKRHLIKVNQTLKRNQVYVNDEGFDFVESFIISHCENI